eukprot:GFUD01027386.1.p1 GENE.GFUD01027386.1~~GFUD01027386.1.p1  ORF type:complete len:4003 (+),score=946.67 GFUD01027386.1:1015-12009(+)
MDGKDGQWFPLEGVKTGKVLLSADFIDELGRKACDILPAILKGGVNDPSGRRDSTNPLHKHPSALHGEVPGATLPNGIAKLKLIRAKELIQADKSSKSDPYALLVYGRQVEKTKVIQNCHEPEWNHEAEFDVPDGDERCFYIQVYDSDKVGKDTPLGNLSLDITDLLSLDGQKGKWFPLSDVKSGKVLLSAEFIDDLGRKASDILPGLLKGGDPNGLGSRKSSTDSPRGDFPVSTLPNGKAKLNLIKAKDLIKADLIGKSDPYAVLIYGKQLQKTKTIKNTLEPQWNHEAEFDVPDGSSRNIYIEVFDSDKIGKDKSLGKLNLDITDVLSMDGQEGKWFPLTGVKSGQLLLSADFVDDLGRNAGEVLGDLQKSDNLNDPDGLTGSRKSSDPLGRDGGRPGIMKKRGSVDPNSTSGRHGSEDPNSTSGRHGSEDPNSTSGRLGSDINGEVPEGKVVMTLVKAKDLIKSDLIGKSDPYAVLTYGLQQHKTPAAKNTQDPIWNHEAPFLIPDGDDRTVNIEVFDSDKIGKDKSLGKLDLDLADVVAMDGEEGRWYPLAGVKSGKILLMSDFIDQFGNDSRGQPSALANRDGSLDPSSNNRKDSSDPLNKYGSPDCNLGIPVGKARFNIIKAKDLIKTDLVGKSDPYAVMKYGRQQNKTPVVKNSQNPEWNHEVDFEIPDGDDRTFNIEVFDSDKIGKDKSMGKLDLDIADVEDMADVEGQEGRWYPLSGVKSGQILLSSEILEQVGKSGRRVPSDSLARKESVDPLESTRNKSLSDQGLNDGKARVNLIKAKDLIKTDITGKSDPYAVIKYGTQKYKTPTAKNTQDPQWDCEVEFDVPEGDAKDLNIEVFDHDKIGKDKSLGKLDMNIADLGNMDKDSGYWFPLTGVKSGQLLLTGEIFDELDDADRARGKSLSGQGLDDGDRARGKSLSGPGSTSPSKRGSVSAGVPAEFADQIPEGQVNINLIKAKDLIKSDMIGKSDPYAVLAFGSQKYKTPKQKNTQNPEWNYEAKFDVPDGPDQTVNIEIFDSDKIGRDKSLGKLDIDVQDILNDDGVDAKWYPLVGVKAGQVLLTSDFLQPGSGGISIPDGIRGGRGSVDPSADKANKSKHSPGSSVEGGIPDGKVHLELIKAKDLENADKKGKSDPYALLKYGNQKMKTNTIRNTQNPQWDFAADFDIPDGSESDIHIEVFDNDKLGRDKSLGKLDLDIGEILNNDGVEGKWYPLKGAKSGEILISSDFLPPGSDNSITSGMPSKAIGGKGSGSADPSKVKAFGPGIEKGKVLPGKPASFSVDSSKTGPAPIEVEIEAEGKVSSRKPSIAQAAPGLHDVTYVPPPVGQDYQIGVKYGGEDIPGSPFEMSSNPDLDDVTGSGIPGQQNGKSGLQDRKESKIGVSVNPDSQNLGKIHVGLIAAKDLIKTDLVGKSDPYAILSHGNQKFKTNTVKNTQNPEWNYDADFNVPDGGDSRIKIDLFDADKFGKDKSLGSAILDVDEVMGKGIVPPGWYPLKGVKSGQVLMSADFEALGSNRLTSPDRSLYGIDDSKDPSVAKSGAGGGKALKNRLGSQDQLGNQGDDLPEGMLHIDLLAARNLAKADMIGKSDPYAVLKLGDQSFKTDTVKNSQNPEWNFGADFVVDSNTPSDIALNIFDQDKFGKDKSLGTAGLSVSDLIDRSDDPDAAATWVPLTGVKSGEVLVDTNFVPSDDMDMNRRMSGHGRGKQNIPDPNAKGLAALKNKGGSSGMRHGDDFDEIPEGNVHVNLIQAKNLMKSDMGGKSDPYGVISCGDDKSKTKTIKNDQNPEFNHEAYFPVDNSGSRNIKIDLFDADKLGSDKPLGSVNIDISDLANNGPVDQEWLPLKNGKSGEVMVSADFQPKFDDDYDDDTASGVPESLSARKEGGGGKGLRDKLKDPKNQGRAGDSILEDLQPGNLHLDLIQAKDLIKADMIGKSDPYAVVSFDDEKLKTKTIKNNQNPEWNFDVDIPIDGDGPRKINIDVFDKDKIGKDKPLGSASLDVADLLKGNDLDKDWIPLDGVKSGKIQVSTDFIPESELEMRKASGLGDGGSVLKNRKDSDMSVDGFSPNSRKNRKESDMSVDGYGPNSRKQSGVGSEYDSDIPAGKIHLNIHEGKDLVKADLIGKSDPYAVVTYGKDKAKTKTIKNNLNPEWDFETDIPVEDNGPSNMKIEVFDSDKIGKDKSLGSALIDVGDLLNEPLEEAWIPLTGTKSGKIKVSADFNPESEDEFGAVQRPSEQGSRKTSDNFDMRKISETQSSYSRKTSEMSETHSTYSRKTSEVFASRKASESQSSYSRKTSRLGGSANDMPGPGTINVNIIQAKDLIKADLIGKSDPYAVVTYGDDKIKTKTIKNNLNPQWNFEADIPIDPNGPSTLKIEIFDDDKLGKDKPLGAADVDIPSLINNATLKDAWIPLSGVKSGQLQLSADYMPLDSDGREKDGKLGGKIIPKPERDGMRNRGGSPGNDDDFGSLPIQRKPSDNNLVPGNIHLNIVQAKDLIKADMIGKSDPFAVVTYGNEQITTHTVKNNQNPEWNFEADIPYNPNYSDTLRIDIFDDDKSGKNKLLGSSTIDIPNLANNEPLDNVWIPLSGVKSGQLQVSADFVPAEFHEYENVHPDQFKKMSPLRDSGALGAPRSAKSPESDKLGKIKLDLLMAKDLIKTDMVGKSDPYAIITHGTQKFKTDIKKNTQNPEWNIECEVEVPDSNDRNISIDLYDADKFGKDTFLGNLNLDIARVMNLGKLDQGWYPLEGVKQGQICVGADFIPELDETSTIIINQKFTESRRTSTQFHEVNLNRIPLPSTGGSIDASIRTPSGRVDKPIVQDDNNGTVAVKYQPTEEGIHYLDVKYNGDQVQGSPFKFHVNRQNNGKASAYGPGLMHGVCGEPANFTVSTKGAGAGGLNLAVEGPSKADISCQDNKDGTVNVSYLPTAPGEYKITAKFADEHIPGSPFTCKITGEGKKRNQISVGSSSELQLPGNLSESDLRSLKAYIESPSGGTEQCFLKKLPRGNIGISFTPREIGEHLVSVQRNEKHITNSPFKIVVNAQEVGDASRVKVSGDGLVQGKTHINNRFMINTKSAGYGGLSLSIEGPSKAEIDCKDNENGTLDVDYNPTEPGFYIINIKFADSHVPGSPFQVPISGEGTEKQTENIKRMREAVPVTEVGSQCRLTFKMPGIFMQDLEAMVTSPSGKSTKANVSELEEGLYAVNFVPTELGIHTVTVRYREVDIPGSPFQFTVGPLQDSGAHRVHAGGPGLARGVEGEPADFNVWTREAGPGSLAISVEGPSKAQIDFKDRKDGSCYVSYVVEEPGEYSVGIRFNDEHIPDSPYKVFIIPKSDHADKVKVSNLEGEEIVLNAPQSFLLSKNGASGSLQCKMVSPSGREDDCFMSQVGPDEYSVRFVPKEEGHHYLHAKLNGVHVPGSPFKIKVGGDGKKDGAVKVFGQGLDRVKTGEKASFVIDTSNVGAGTLSVTVDGPSKVDMDCNEVEKGYEVSYMPLVPGDYFVTVKYNGKNVDGSPFKVTATGGGAPGAKGHLLSRRESSSVTMETIQRTMIRQESSMFKESSTVSSSRSSSRAIAIQPNFVSDASAVTCKGPGIERPVLGKQNSFTVDCTRGGNNVLFVGVFGPDTPCDEVYVKHQGDRQYGVSYKLTDKGQYILYVKWGDDHIPGSPFHIEV